VWAESERRLYPLATSAPERYMELVRLVRAVGDGLAGITSSDELLQHWAEGTDDLVLQTASQHGLELGDFPARHVAGAAFALRAAEVAAVEHRRERVAQIATASSAGQAWVTLNRCGSLAAGLLDPFQSVDMHLASGLAIVSSVTPHYRTGAASYEVSLVRMDPATGDLLDADPRLAEPVESADADSYSSSFAGLRAFVEQQPH
jgi:hypothetical protein